MRKIINSFLSFNPVSISFVFILFFTFLFFWGIEILDVFELKTYDQRLLWRGAKKPSPKVVAAVIDEKSLDVEGKWPWPRSKMARLISKLSDEGAAVIGLDVFFTEPDKSLNIEVINQFNDKLEELNIKNNELLDYIEEEKDLADNDAIFTRAIEESKAKVVLSYFWHLSKNSMGYELSDEEMGKRTDVIGNSAYSLIKYEGGKQFDPFVDSEMQPYAPEANLESLTNVSSGSGYIDNSPPRLDGVIREFPMAIKFNDNIYMPFSLQCAWQYLGQPNLILNIIDEFGVDGIKIGDIHIPTDMSGRLLVNYLGPPRTIPNYSITDIFQDKLPKDTFKDKIVIVGSTAIGAHDMRNTPFAANHPGLENHATIIDNILRNDFISKPEWTKTFDVIILFFLGIILMIAIPRTGAIAGLSVAVFLIIFHVFVCRWLFSSFGIWVSMIYPILEVIFIYSALTAYHYLIEEKNKRFLHSTFSSYLSPDLIADMVSSETMPELGGEARVITAYFTDIQSFSVFSEKLTAQQLVELLNEYLSVMTDILLEQKGTLDKYEGDAIIAFLGAPMWIPDHSLRACKVAVDMQGELNELREKWRNEKLAAGEPERNTKNLPPDEWAPGARWPEVVHNMMMRIGVNTGEIVVGNMGSTMRMDYTMMGDSVNLAARLEEGAKQYGIYTAVSEFTLNAEFTNEYGEKDNAMNHVEARFIDNITVVGKSEPVKIYELCAMKGDLTEKDKNLFNHFDRGVQHYLNMQWDEAIECFSESLKYEHFPEAKTTPSEVYIKRCTEFKKSPPVPDGQKWDGVYRMTRK